MARRAAQMGRRGHTDAAAPLSAQGLLRKVNGDTYQGGWVKGHIEGHGRMVYAGAGETSHGRRQHCQFADTLSAVLLKHLLKWEGGAADWDWYLLAMAGGEERRREQKGEERRRRGGEEEGKSL